MLERKIYKSLLEWKNNPDKMCLVVKGARQVGKTYIIEKFARENYKNYIYMNFDENPGYKAIFDGDLNVENLIKQISLRVPKAEIVPNKTLIFLDEIQNCPNARTALKFLAIDKRFDVIASGSLLGINYREVESFPVGYTEQIEMYSLDFEEFLWANGIREQSILDVKQYFDNKEVVPTAIHERMMGLFKEYIVVGGMPRVVDNFVKNHNFANVLKLQRGIINDYEDDIAKYAEGESVPVSVTAEVNVLAIGENTLSFGVYPNPAENVLNIVSNANNFEYQLVNGLGQVVAAGIANGNAQINVSSIENGVYFLKIVADGNQKVVKVTVK